MPELPAEAVQAAANAALAARIAREAFTAGVGSGGDAPVRPSTAPQGDATGVPGVPGSPEGAQGISAPREACRICGHLTDSGKVCGPCRATPGVLDAAVERADRMAEMVIEKDREATQWADWLHQAEATIARVRELADRLCQEPHPTHDHICPDGLRAELLAALGGAGAVPGEHTGSGNE